MKKLLSIILATAMLISLIPAVFAADTGAEAGIKVVYDFKSDKFADLVNDTDTAATLDLNELTYAESKGFWKYAASSMEPKDTLGKKTTGFRADSSGYIYVMASPTTPQYWIAVKIDVPKQGNYDISLTTYTTSTNSGIRSNTHINAFIFKAEETANIKDLLVIGNDYNLDYTNPATSSKKHKIGTNEPLDAGEYYFVVNPYQNKNTTTNVILYLQALTLTENGTGTGNAIMGGKISGVSDTLEIDDTATVSATGYLSSTGAEISDFTYSVEGDAVEIVGNTLTANAAGTATITATSADAVEGCNTITKTVTVTAPAEPEEDAELTEAFTPDDTNTLEAAVYTDKVEALPYVDGAEVTEGVTATAKQLDDGTYQMSTSTTDKENTFLYWVKGLDGGAKRVVSRAESFVYAPTGGVVNYLIAVYEKNGATTPKAEFYNANGLLYKTVEGASGSTPELPTMAGYGTAKRWVAEDGTTYAGNVSITVTDTMMLIAEYDDPTADITVTTNETCKTDKEEYAYGEKVTCTLTGNGTFYAWTKDGEIVSTDPDKYEFSAWEDCTVNAVYKEDYVPLTSVARKIIIDVFGNNNVMAEFIGFDNAVEKGIILDDTTKITMTSKKSQFTVELGEATSAKGYAVVKNTDGTYTEYIDGSYSKTEE